MNVTRISLSALAGALLCSASAAAQTTAAMGPAALQGTVSSTEEGAMEGVLVSAKKAGSTITTTVVTDEKGHYAFPASRLEPGHYNISIRAVGYALPAAKAADITAGKALAADLALKKVTDVHQLAAQLTNAEWLISMPGEDRQKPGCVSCHTLKPIVNSTHTSAEWEELIPRMATYSNPSALTHPQPLVPGPRTERAAPRDPVVLKRTADYLASINLSKGKVWSYPLKTLPRPKGRATHVIITTYDLPRAETMPHDAITTADGHAWYSDFGYQYIGEIDPKTGKVTEYNFPTLKPRQPKGFLEIRTDPDGNLWAAGMHQGLIAKIDGKTKKTTVYPIPAEWQSNSTQESMISPQHSNVDGYVWTNNQDDHSILRLDVKTGKFENLGPFKNAKGEIVDGYGIPSDRDNSLYLLQFGGTDIGRLDAKTKQLKLYSTPFPASRPRRGMVGDDGNLWFAEYGGNAIAMFDPKTEAIKEWQLPIKFSWPYDVTRNKKGDVWTGSMVTDRVTRLNPTTGEFVDYLMPQEVNIRRVFFDDARNEFWIGANHSAHVLKVEPLD